MGMGMWLRGMRPKTLPASVAPVAIGAAAGWESLRGLEVCPAIYPRPDYCDSNAALLGVLESRFWVMTLLCALVALFLQIAVNLANDYADGVRGVDAGRGAQGDGGVAPARLVASGVPPKRVLLAAGVAAALACLCGCAVVAVTGHWWLLLAGACCVLAGWFYTGGRHPYGYAGLGELAVFVFFGLVAVLGTEYVVSDGVSVAGWFGAVYAGVFSCVLLMVNNLRDLDNDRRHGKRTLAVRMGGPVARWFLTFVYCVAALSVVAIVVGRMAVALVHWSGVACGYGAADGGVRCAPIPPTGDEWVPGILGFVLLALAVVMVRALLRRDYGRALPLASLTLLLYAVIFVSLMPSVVDALTPLP